MKAAAAYTIASDIWNICGSFGGLQGELKTENNVLVLSSDKYVISESFETDEYGVTVRSGSIKNTSAEAITLNCLMSKFVFSGGEYEVYTQYNGWQNESIGGWQPLVTSVGASVDSVRTCMGATPMLALWNRQSGRGTVFHLVPYSAWEMKASRVSTSGETSVVKIEAGINQHNFSIELKPGETVQLPEIIYYEFRNKTDFDCYKLHNFCNNRYPKHRLPVMYNTWMCRFDRITFENVYNQVESAARLGVEYFVIDAGWFGNGDGWVNSRGDWEENQTAALSGHMGEIADHVRKYAMKFGFWLEIETASEKSEIVKAHPEYYIVSDGKYFLDFTNEAAYQYMFETVTGLIAKYKAEFIKFDFNQDMFVDKDRAAFVKYLAAYNAFIGALKKVYPDLYLESCASGGMRMNLGVCGNFDSIWLSDNQDVYEGMRIYKNTILRMPPQMIEKWGVFSSLTGFTSYESDNPGRLLAARDATCDVITGVHASFVEGFFAGSPIGFSCDLNGISDTHFEVLKKYVENFKRERDFWQTAVCRILTDTDSMLIFEYSDIELRKIKISVMCNRIKQESVCVFPAVDNDKNYICDGVVRSGAEINSQGIIVHLEGNHKGKIISFEETMKN